MSSRRAGEHKKSSLVFICDRAGGRRHKLVERVFECHLAEHASTTKSSRVFACDCAGVRRHQLVGKVFGRRRAKQSSMYKLSRIAGRAARRTESVSPPFTIYRRSAEEGDISGVSEACSKQRLAPVATPQRADTVRVQPTFGGRHHVCRCLHQFGVGHEFAIMPVASSGIL